MGATQWNSATLGAANDVVELHLGLGANNRVVVCESYDIDMAIFDQPSSFSLRLGTGDLLYQLLLQYPNGSPFKIVVGGQDQFTGYTDGFDAVDDGNGSTVAFEGRDVLAALVEDEIEKEESFTAATHLQLFQKAIVDVGLLKPFELDPPNIIPSNAANRFAVTGQNIPITGVDTSEAQLLQIAGSTGDAFPVLRTHLGETRLNLLRRHLDAAGLFPWAAASGDIVVGVPQSNQPPCAKFLRKRGGTPTSNVVKARYRNTLRGRYSEVVLYGKSSGRKYARTTIRGAFVDDEVVAAGFKKKRVLRNLDITSVAHAEHLAKKELASCRRRAFHLEYTIAGHSAPSLISPGERVVIAPDIVVRIDDDEYNLHDEFWIESVSHYRRPFTQTTFRMLPLSTLVFGDQAFPTPR